MNTGEKARALLVENVPLAGPSEEMPAKESMPEKPVKKPAKSKAKEPDGN